MPATPSNRFTVTLGAGVKSKDWELVHKPKQTKMTEKDQRSQIHVKQQELVGVRIEKMCVLNNTEINVHDEANNTLETVGDELTHLED